MYVAGTRATCSEGPIKNPETMSLIFQVSNDYNLPAAYESGVGESRVHISGKVSLVVPCRVDSGSVPIVPKRLSPFP